MPYTYEYSRPAVTVDIIVLRNAMTQVLLIKRLLPPFENQWALPGGFVEMEETLEKAAERELEEETGITGISLSQFHAFSDPDRDPRHRTISVVFWGEAGQDKYLTKAGSDAKEAKWFEINNLPSLAFDHDKILRKAVTELINRM
ncbi:MAG: NUDIX hydrolase [Bacteroidales bacterium]|jgi:8-oxo-dGTP diphosphatase|nr:NUDIX hydrolase [Bacteroidales bacterium]